MMKRVLSFPVFLFMIFPVVFTSGAIKGFINHVVVKDMECQGTDLLVMATENTQQCLRLCWLYSDCTIVTFYPHTFLCRLLTDSPTDLTTILVSHNKAISVDLRQASVHKPRLYGCDHRRCMPRELCVPVVDPDTYKCLPLGYEKCPSSPPSVPNAVLTMDGMSKVMYTCEDGYVLSGSDDVTTCDVTTGLWSAIDVRCTFLDCGTPPVVDGTTASFSNTFYDAKVVYTCYDGYLSPSSTMEVACQASSQWASPPLSCTLMQCQGPTSVTNGSVTVLDRVLVNPAPKVSVQELEISYGGTVLHTCDEGFQSPTRPNFRSQCQSDGSWESTSGFTCNPIDCNRPPAIANTWSSFNSTTFQSKVAYMCVEGYDNGTNSTVELTCVSNGTWLGSEVTCQMVDCGTPPEEKNATASYNTTTYLSEAKYTCDAQTIMYQRDVQSRVCQGDGHWSDEEVSCIVCGRPPEIAHSSFNITKKGSSVLYAAEYSCDDGFRHSLSDRFKVCSDGEWKGDDPVCLPISCGEPVNVHNASVVMNGTILNSIAIYSCDEGFTPTQSNATTTLVCGSDGWMDNESKNTVLTNLLECRKMDCGSPPLVDNTVFEVTTNRLNNGIQIATYSCLPGYSLTSDSNNIKVCKSQGWEMTNITCERNGCGDAPQVINAVYEIRTDNSSNYIQIASYSCQEGFTLTSTSSTKRCIASSWENISVTCEKLDCGTPKELPNATWVFDSSRNEATDLAIAANPSTLSVLYTCEEGYVYGQYLVDCVNGNWTPYEAVWCPSVDCGPPPAAENVTEMIIRGTSYRESVFYGCENGRNWTIICQSNRTWSNTGNLCEDENDCGPSPGFPNAILSYTDADQMNDVIYICQPGYVLNRMFSSTQLTCILGDWVGEIATAIEICKLVDCESPPTMPNAVPLYNTTTLNSSVSYQCNPGYFPASPIPHTRICNESGAWSGIGDFGCFSSECGQPPSIAHAAMHLPGDLIVGSSVSYSCDEGFEFAENKSEIKCVSINTWGGLEIECLELTCGPVPVVDDANYGLKSVLGMLEATYYCDHGYREIETGSTNVLTCHDRGEWNGTAIKCGPEQCADPPFVENASFTLSSKKIGERVTYQCNKGYQHWGSDSKTCTQEGAWSLERIECNAIDCGEPGDIPHSRKSFNNTTYGYGVLYECESGYGFTLGSNRTCTETGAWSNEWVECVAENISSCAEPPKFPYSTVYHGSLVESAGYISVATYICDHGYTRYMEAYDMVCALLTEYLWLSVDANNTCSPVICDTPPELTDGVVTTLVGNTFGSRVFYTCQRGYQMAGPGFKTCQANGNWSSEISECYETGVVRFCPEPPEVENATARVLSYTGDAVYTCLPGYIGPTVHAYHCDAANARWELKEEISCKPVDCNIPKNVSGSSVTVYETTFGNRAVYECLSGYRQIAPYISICNESGSWEGPGTSPCVPIESVDLRTTCPTTIPEIPNAEGTLKSDGDTSKIVYSCKKGYSSTNASYVISCQESGEWDDYSHIICEPIEDCANIPDIENATLLELTEKIPYPESGEIYHIATYSCQQGYIKNGTDPREALKMFDLICASISGWREAPSCSVVDCGVVSLANATTDMVERLNGTTYGSEASLVCRPPYIGNGSISVCQEFGNWSQVELTCEIPNCEVPPAIQGGKMTPVRVDKESGVSSWLVECSPGFQYLAEANWTVDCRVEPDTLTESWTDTGVCVRVKWTDVLIPFYIKMPYHLRQYFNTIDLCASGTYQKRLANGREPNIALRSRKSISSPLSSMSFIIHPRKSTATLQYSADESTREKKTVFTKTVSVRNDQYLTICSTFFLFNSTFRISLDGKVLGSVSHEVTDISTTPNKTMDWANYFVIHRDINVDFVNITYSTL